MAVIQYGLNGTTTATEPWWVNDLGVARTWQVAAEMSYYDGDLQKWIKVWPSPPETAGTITYSALTYNSGTDRYETTLSWPAMAPAPTTWEVEWRHTQTTGQWSDWAQKGTTVSATRSLAVTGLFGQTSYEFRVRGVTTSGGAGAWSPVQRFATPPQKVRSVTITNQRWTGTNQQSGLVTVTAPFIGTAYQTAAHPVTAVAHRNVAWLDKQGAGATWSKDVTIGIAPSQTLAQTADVYTDAGNVSLAFNWTAPALSPPAAPTLTFARFYWTGTYGSTGFLVDWYPQSMATSYVLRLYNGSNVLQGTVETAGTDLGNGQLRHHWTGAYTANANYRVTVAAKNAAGESAAVDTGWRMRIPNPVLIHPDDSNTWRNSGWRNLGYQVQGWGSNGVNYGCLFYGNKFRDAMHSSVIGYGVNMRAFTVRLRRREGGSAAASLVGVGLHPLANDGASLVPSTVAGLERASVARFTTIEMTLPAHWAGHLVNQDNGWKGLVLRTDPGETGCYWDDCVAVNYQTHEPHSFSLGGGLQVGSCYVWHDG